MNKVILTYLDANGDVAKESIWVVPFENFFKVDNIPFFAPNLALNDIISVEEENGVLHFEDLIAPSGHSTIQIALLKVNERSLIINDLEGYNCAWEGFQERIIALDIPPSCEYKKVKAYLCNQENKKVLDYKEAALSDKHKQEVYQ